MTDTTITTTANTPGIKGLTRSTWRDESHLRGMLLKLIAQNPDATRDELEELYLTKARKKEALVREALVRAFDNDLARVQQPARHRRQRSAAAEVDVLVGSIKTTVLLDFALPSGKKLRDSTGRECQEAGGWLVQVAQRVGVRGIVGEVLSEEEVRSIFASNGRKQRSERGNVTS